MSKEHPIRIIGAGVSGLVAAIRLQKAGFDVVVHEKNNHIGGRLSTTRESGLPFDHGFQVLLTEYPLAKKYLDYDALDLERFNPGAAVFRKGRRHFIGDPRRNLNMVWPSLVYPWAELSDKLKLARLSAKLKHTSLDAIFSRDEQTTEEYLLDIGFSEKIIDSFFKPFFGGIYLEPNLKTSSRMFEFVLKMFSSGDAAVPREGIQAIAKQLGDQLEPGTIRREETVVESNGQSITLASGDSLPARALLHTTPKEESMDIDWNQCLNIYFECEGDSRIRAPFIGLIASPEAHVSNFHYLTDLFPEVSVEKAILSATVLLDGEVDEEVGIERAREDLKVHAGIEGLKYLKSYHISRALPVLQSVKYEPDEQEIRGEEGEYFAGDYLAAPSLNAAMRSGEKAAECILEVLT